MLYAPAGRLELQETEIVLLVNAATESPPESVALVTACRCAGSSALLPASTLAKVKLPLTCGCEEGPTMRQKGSMAWLGRKEFRRTV